MTEALVLLAICAVSSILTTRSGHSVFAPWNLMILAQCGAVGIAYTNLSPSMRDLHWFTWVVFASGLAFFLVGSVVGWSTPAGEPKSELDEQWIFRLVIVLLLVYAFGIALGLAAVGTFPSYAPDPAAARSVFIWPPPLGRIAGFAQSWASGILLLLAWLSLRAKDRFRRFSAWGMTAGMILVQTLVGTRFNLISWFLFLLVIRDDAGRKAMSLFKNSLVVLGVFLTMSFLFLVRIGSENIFQFMSLANWRIIRAFTLMPVYLYFANNVWNLDHVLRKVADGVGHAWTMGLSSTFGIFFFAGFPMDLAKALRWDMALEYRGQSTVDERLNTLTYHWELFKDFGLLGVVGGSFVFGLFATWTYRMVVLGRGERWAIWNALVAFSVAMSFFTLAWAQAPFLVCACTAWLATRGGSRSS